MAHFRGTIQGVRGEASRLGTKKTGLTVTADGWDFGVEVRLWHDAKEGKDRATVYVTRGSNGGGRREVLRLVEGSDLGELI